MESSAALRLRSVGLTDVGRKRKHNEDAFLNDDVLRLYLVADGMGGHAAGEVASMEAVDTIFGMVKRGVPALPKLGDGREPSAVHAVSRLVESAVQAATYMVHSIAELDASKSGMGTTMSALFVYDGFAVTGQVGDSRIYLVRDGEAHQLTEDHTYVNWQLRSGLITKEEAERSPKKNVITRSVGNHEYVEVDVRVVPLRAGDRLLVCSDGLHGYLRDGDLEPIVALGIDDAAPRLIALANERGGKDNITAVLVEVDG
jgi:serine/threonine protein phosphatase PrpC